MCLAISTSFVCIRMNAEPLIIFALNLKFPIDQVRKLPCSQVEKFLSSPLCCVVIGLIKVHSLSVDKNQINLNAKLAKKVLL